MNRQQALREARRRWGKTGAVTEYRNGMKSVGIEMGFALLVKGTGATWASAFRDIDDKAERRRLFDAADDEPCPRCSRTMSTRTGRPSSECWPAWEPDAEGQYVCWSCFLNARIPASLHRRVFRRRLGYWRAVGQFTAALVWIQHGQFAKARNDLQRAEKNIEGAQ